jgi:PKD repeat protein
MKAYNTDNCVDSVYREVRVYKSPEPLFSYISQPCDSTIHFTDSTLVAGSGSIASWKWIWGDGQTTTITAPGTGDTSHLYINPGFYTVRLIMTTSHGCVDSVTRTVQRFPCITTSFTYNDTLCARNKIAFADNSLPVSLITKWKWSWDDGTPDTTYTVHNSPIYHTFADSGSYHVKVTIWALVDGTSISDSSTNVIKVRPTPFTYFSNVPVCLNQPTLFRDTSKTFGAGVKTWAWTFGVKPTDTSSFKNPNHTYDTAGIYDVRLITTNKYGCKDSLTKPTRIYGLPEAHYENTTACVGDPTFFTDISVKSDTTFGYWKWSFGDPATTRDTSSMKDPSYRYPATGDYSIRMIVRDHFGCIDTVDSTVKVNVTPLSSFTAQNGYNGKQGQVKMNNLSTGADNYTWDFGNGETSIEENPVALYTEDGTYTIKLISMNNFNCTDTTYYTYELLFKGLYVPNAFSPSGTNLGVRLFQPIGMNLKQYHVTVFDAWGHQMWESTKLDDKGSPTEGWDGTFEGVLMPQGNYMWKISALFVDDSPWEGSDIGVGGSTKSMGTVVLIR